MLIQAAYNTIVDDALKGTSDFIDWSFSNSLIIMNGMKWNANIFFKYSYGRSVYQVATFDK